MARNSLGVAGLGVFPKSMFFSFPAEDTAMAAKVTQKPLASHPTTTGSCLASGGKARRDSSRL
jgi:hypothetical protein